MVEHADYIIFADESGDHSLTSIDPDFPMFCLTLCVFEKQIYVETVVPEIQKLKFRFWGHDAIILHEHEIRKTKGDFAFLRGDPVIRNDFYESVNDLIQKANFSVIASVIDKNRLVQKYTKPWNPYDIALHFALERLLIFLRGKGQSNRRAHILFECRGRAEDDALELSFRRIVAGENQWGWTKADFSTVELEPRFVKKAANSTGLQLADLTARPIALKSLRPEQENRAYAIIEDKIISRKVFP